MRKVPTSERAAKRAHDITFKFKSGSRFDSEPKSSRVSMNRKSRTAHALPMRAVQFFCVLPRVFAVWPVRLFAPAEKPHHRLREIFPSLQIIGDPNILLGKSSAREVRDVELATTGQLGVLPCLFAIVMCPLHPGFHVSAPQLTPNEY
jgi:hypothetical protein